MALPPLASLDDFEAQRGPIDDDDVARTEGALDRASSRIRVEAGKPWVNTDGDALDFGDLAVHLQEAIVGICIDAAARALDNPDGVSQETQALGDASLSRTYANTSSDVYLTAQEKSTIRKAAGLRSIGVIATTREDPVGVSDLGYVDRCGTVYADVSPAGQSIPWLQEGQLG